MKSEFLTIDEVSSLLKVHRNTVTRWLERGVFPNSIRIEATIRIPQADVDALKQKPQREAV